MLLLIPLLQRVQIVSCTYITFRYHTGNKIITIFAKVAHTCTYPSLSTYQLLFVHDRACLLALCLTPVAYSTSQTRYYQFDRILLHSEEYHKTYHVFFLLFNFSSLINSFISCLIYLIQLGTSATNKGASIANVVRVIILYYYTLRNYVLIKRKTLTSTSKSQTETLEHTMIALLS